MGLTRQIWGHPPRFSENTGKCSMDTKEISQCFLKQLTAFILKSHSPDTITTMYRSISFLSSKG